MVLATARYCVRDSDELDFTFYLDYFLFLSSLLALIALKIDLIPRSRFGGSSLKKTGEGGGEGRGGNEIWQIRIETSADWLFRNARESCTRVLFLSLAVPKQAKKVL